MENSKSKKLTVAAIALFVIVFGGLLALASVFDLQVSNILARLEPGAYLTTNPFGVIFECIGSWPVYAFIAVACAIFFTNIKRSQNKAWRIIGSTIANIASVIAMYVLVTDTVKYLERHFEVEHFTETIFATVIFVFIAAALGELTCLAFSKVDDDTAKALLKFAFVIIFCAALSNIIVNIIKNIMYRPRYRTMNFLGDTDFSNFHRWYQKSSTPVITETLQAVVGGSGKDAYRSFPSGHTCAAGTVYSILALPYLFKKYDTTGKKFLVWFCAIFVTGVVAVSRIVCGAHFFSDVLIGGTISFLCVMLAIKIFIKKDFNKV